jgi:hypothetical protein
MSTPLVGQSLTAKVVRVSATTLFHVAARELGDASMWDRIARLNGLTDPWIGPMTELKVPRPGKSTGGILA